jgi:hypothetical protein
VYYFVGTAYVDPEEREPTKGRILVLQVRLHELAPQQEHLTQKHRNAAERPCQQLSLAQPDHSGLLNPGARWQAHARQRKGDEGCSVLAQRFPGA